MLVETKYLKASVSVLILALAVLLLFFLIGRFFEPMDTFSRLDKKAQCSDESWSSVAVYRKKAHWFSADTDIFVTVSNSQGKIVHEEKLYQLDSWNDLSGNMRGSAPAGFCNKALFVSQQ